MKIKFSSILILSILFLACNSYASNYSLTENTVMPDSTKKWRQLFNGKDLTGWKHVGNGHMTVALLHVRFMRQITRLRTNGIGRKKIGR